MKIGLLMTILTVIFMKENCIPERPTLSKPPVVGMYAVSQTILKHTNLHHELWKALKKIGIDPDSKHPVFGDIKKFVMQDLVKQLYLQYNKEENSDPPIFIFSWGFRAKLEVSKMEVLRFVCDIFGDGMTPQQWPNHYMEAITLEEHTETCVP